MDQIARIVASVMFVAANIADVTSTNAFLKSGNGVEVGLVNWLRISKFLQRALGKYWWIGRLLPVPGFIYIFWQLALPPALFALLSLSAMTTLAVVNNYKIAKK